MSCTMMMKARSDGVTESTLYIRLMTPEMFRRYTLVAENGVSVSTRDVAVTRSTISSIYLLLLKLAFHGTDTDTDILADFRASIVHEPDTHEDPRRLVRHAARFSSRGSSQGCPLGMRACIRELTITSTISYRVHVYKITRQAHP